MARKGRKLKAGWIVFVIIVLALIGFGEYLYHRPVAVLAVNKTVAAKQNPQKKSAKLVDLPWPPYGESAIGTLKAGVLTTHGTQTPLPTASTAKIMCALTVLDKYPLGVDEKGPTITLGRKDVKYFNDYYVKDGSLVAIKAGEKITEHKALEAMLLPSANNMAESLAVWAYGSVADYRARANQLAKQYGLDDTHIYDASGFSPKTTSTAADLVRLGRLALQNPLLKQIVGERVAHVPVAGKIYNVNYLVGQDGINGIKTGNNNQDHGVYLFSAIKELKNGKKVQIIGAVMGAPHLITALKAAKPLIDAAPKNFVLKSPVQEGKAYASYTIPWSGKKVSAIAGKSISFVSWGPSTIKTHVNLQSLDAINQPLALHTKVGTITVNNGNQTFTSPLVLSQNIQPPTTWWRLTHF
jgi:D-alanyl-D-alanine carboxypeptidase (penicillin-binding protein 5/6)